MRKILMLILVFISFQVFGQGDSKSSGTWTLHWNKHIGYFISYSPPANYQYRVVYERLRGMMPDSAFHLPRYNGVPVGLRGGSATEDGALAADTLNGRIYHYWNTTWNRLANYSEIAGASSNIYNTNGILTGNRQLTGLNNTYYLALDSLNYFRVDRNGVTRIYMDNTSTLLASPDNSRTLQIFNASTRLTGLAVGPGEKQLRIVPGTGIITYADTSTGGGTTFVDDTWIMNDNVDATKQLQFQLSGISPSNIRTLTIPDASGVVALSNVSNNWADGIGQSFNPNGTTAGINVGGHSSDPSSLADGDIWYNFSSNELKARINGASVALGSGGGSGTVNTGAANKAAYYPSAGTTVDDVTGVEFNGTNILQKNTAQNAADVGLQVNGTTSQSADVLQVKDVGGTELFSVRPNGAVDILPSFEPWYEVYSNFAFSDQPLFRLSNFGAGSTIGTLNGSTIFDGWQFGLYMETGTTTTGSAYSYGYSSGQIAGIAISNSFRYNVGGLVRVEDLSDGTETYNYSLGFGDDWGNGVSAIVDGVYFEYTHSLNSGNWTCTTESNGTKTQTDSGIPVAADTDYTLEVSVLGGNAFFYINKTLVATNTTNIPTGTARATTIGHAIAKSAGTTNRKAYVEWFAYGKRAN